MNCVAKVHDRMPVILGATDYDKWLDSTLVNPADVKYMLPADVMFAEPVTTHVNNVRNHDAACLAPARVRGRARAIEQCQLSRQCTTVAAGERLRRKTVMDKMHRNKHRWINIASSLPESTPVACRRAQI